MNSSDFKETDLAMIVGGAADEFVYDLGRVIRFIGLSGGGTFVGNAVADWMGTSAINSANK